jgi:hypothetical protein
MRGGDGGGLGDLRLVLPTTKLTTYRKRLKVGVAAALKRSVHKKVA